HRAIAADIIAEAQAASAWAQKAAAYISSVKTHGREAHPSVSTRINVSAVAAETQALLSHRLRATGCHIEFVEDQEGITVVGNPGRLSQILLNLCANAIDAYEDAEMAAGRVEVRARRRDQSVLLTVRDSAGGIPPEVLP